MAGATPEASDTVVAVDAVDAVVEVTVANLTAAEVSGTVVEILLHYNCLVVLLFDKTNLLQFPFFYPCLSFSSYGCFLFLCLHHGFS